MSHQFRTALPTDGPALLDVHRRSITRLGRAAYTEEECESWAAGLVSEGYGEAMTNGGETFFVAEDGAGICGFCSFNDDEIKGLYVHPRASRTGVGSSLLKRAESELNRNGRRPIRLSAALSALPFYQAHGYRIVQRKKWTTRGGIGIVVCDMEKSADEG